jgi:serine/threonine-protein kinase
VTTPPAAPLGTVGHYNLLERLDPSGPGELFRARDTHRGRTVAIRLLPADFAAAADARTLLVDDARPLTALSHPNITTLFEAGEEGGRVYFAFEFARGRSLRSEMAGRTMNPRRALEIAIQVADAVAEAHAAGFAHGGLSPESIVVTDKGRAKIPTFHLASLVGFDEARGDPGLRDYESPEEARGERPDDRSDVYSVAAIGYEMLTARRAPHKGASAPSAWNPRVSRELDEVILKSLAPNPDSRHQSAATFAAALRAVAAGLSGAEVEDDEEPPPGASRSRRVALAAAALAVAALTIGWMLTRS